VLERTPADHADTTDNAAKGPDSVVL
jgi:hypothetical protein